MKVLHVVPCYVPAYRYGGPVKSIHELCKSLVDSGVDVTVFTTNANGSSVLDVKTNTPVFIDGVKVFYFPVGWPVLYFYSFQLKKALKEKISEYDLVHIHWLYVYTTLVASRECIQKNVPYLLSPRGMLDSNAISLKSSFKKKFYLKFIEKKHLANASYIQFSSLGEQLQAEKSGWQFRSCVVGNGLYLEDYIYSGPTNFLNAIYPETKGKKLVLFLGRLNYIKGIELLIKAWSNVLRKVPNSHLIIAGPDNDGFKPKIVQWLQEGDLQESVTFTGMLKGAEKLSAIWESDLFVSTSYLESFGMAIVEAMACKKPIVVSNRVNISPEIDEYGAGLVTSLDPNEISEAIVKLLNDKHLSNSCGANGYRLVTDKYTWNKIIDKILTVYTEVMSLK